MRPQNHVYNRLLFVGSKTVLLVQVTVKPEQSSLLSWTVPLIQVSMKSGQ